VKIHKRREEKGPRFNFVCKKNIVISVVIVSTFGSLDGHNLKRRENVTQEETYKKLKDGDYFRLLPYTEIYVYGEGNNLVSHYGDDVVLKRETSTGALLFDDHGGIHAVLIKGETKVVKENHDEASSLVWSRMCQGGLAA